MLCRRRELKLLRSVKRPLREERLPSRRPLLPVPQSLSKRRKPRGRLPRRGVKRPRNGPKPRERPLLRGDAL